MTESTDALRQKLAAETGRGEFREALVADLPEPARRYFLHAIAPGTPLARSVELEMHGRIRVGAWLPFRAREVLAPRTGFLWQARAGYGPLAVLGADSYAGGQGAIGFRLCGVIPLLRASGPDVSRSARGRAVSEAIWVPSVLLPGNGVRWQPIDDRNALATVELDGEALELRLAIDGRGALRSVTLERWGNPEGGAFVGTTFGCAVEEEHTFGGYTIPARVRAGWWFGTDRFARGEFFRASLDAATFR